MNGANGQFCADPAGFLRHYVVNNVRFLQAMGHPGASPQLRMLLNMAEALKEASFDLVRNELEAGSLIYDLTLSNQVVSGESAINAYWCPFIQGTVTPGFVDVPRHNPAHRFVFTPAMNGCAFFITPSPKGESYFRLYHNQHPHNAAVRQHIATHCGSDRVLSTFTFKDYGTDAHPNAFNFLHYQNSRWVYISQPQTINMATRQVLLRPGGRVVTAAVL